MSEVMRPFSSYISTSVDDCRIDLSRTNDLPWLHDFRACLEGMEGTISRRKVVETRIRQVERERERERESQNRAGGR